MKLSTAMFLLSLVTVVVAAVLAILNVDIILLKGFVLAICLLEFVALAWIETAMRWSPRGLFFLGWTFPFLVAQAPIDLLIFDLPKITNNGYLAFFLVSICFYIAQLFVMGLKNARALQYHVIKQQIVEEMREYSPIFIIMTFGLAAVGAYLVSLIHAGGVPPILRSNPTEASKTFWALSGSATIFSLSRLFFLFIFIHWIFSKYTKQQKRSVYDYVFFLLTITLLLCMFSYGKRAVFLYTAIPIVMAMFIFCKVKMRYMLLLMLFGSFYLIVNTYIRATYGFEHYWAGRSFNNLSGPFVYSLIQPLQYVNETFGNMSQVMELTGLRNLYGQNTAAVSMLAEFSNRGKMMPLFGVLIGNYGLVPTLAINFGLFLVFWIIYRKSTRGVWLLTYCIMAPGLALLWTSVVLETQSMYRLALIFIVWCGIVDIIRNNRSTKELTTFNVDKT